MAKDAYYFSHDANARLDPKNQAMICKYGMAGYGMYWIIIEMLGLINRAGPTRYRPFHPSVSIIDASF